eukprot:CAMPEP_0113935924 /NCGR_PEP_ID=MMETSP1339-20121228/2948_1 /TAXON_ID=94617 /ORGANISM="Fibrocapsa japonica" /LENGTH=125 /DNA_ID=CAMNT_0000938219 /DNA_START=23 /DNA_END=400 /DNA_ORIENTATION=- /assembly_acc=CAM_ASM_000762
MLSAPSSTAGSPTSSKLPPRHPVVEEVNEGDEGYEEKKESSENSYRVVGSASEPSRGLDRRASSGQHSVKYTSRSEGLVTQDPDASADWPRAKVSTSAPEGTYWRNQRPSPATSDRSAAQRASEG